MTTSYTYISRKRSYYKPLIFTEPIIVPAYISTARKLANIIKNYLSVSTFWFNEWEDLGMIFRHLIRELGYDEKIGNIGWNKFTIEFQGMLFKVERVLAEDFKWKYFRVEKIKII